MIPDRIVTRLTSLQISGKFPAASQSKTNLERKSN